jgi:phosphohistidine phosphatase
MELILWRHADAEDGVPDLERRLTGKGRKQAERMAKWLKPRIDGNWVILSSPALRACETAEALGVKFEIRDRLSTDTSAKALLHEAQWPTGNKNVVIVGHQPVLGEVAAQLIGLQDAELAVKKGAIWWFAASAGIAGETVTLRAVIGPDVVSVE